MAKAINTTDPNEAVRIEGTPSKELFIDMLVKDLSLKDAIGDLVDNSVDAANKSNRLNSVALKAITISLIFDYKHFEINDNAGGMEEDVARNNAFKLGKPKNFTQGRHTIGQFGIGMKRAFFKLGEIIHVNSVALTSDFSIKISVNDWRNRSNEKDWDFSFESVHIQKHEFKDTKMQIQVFELKDDVRKLFANPQFELELREEIAKEHQIALNNGLTIKINGKKLIAPKITLINSKQFQPVYWRHEFPNGLEAEILVGISEDNGSEGGWYIFCNDRLILGPETTELTGWTGGKAKGGKEGSELPKYHDQYFRFRGYVFFNADDSSKLPWTTSKTGIERDSKEFSYVRSNMISLGKPVKQFLDLLKKEREKDNPESEQKLNLAVAKSDETSVLTVSQVMQNKNTLPKVYTYPDNLFNPKKKKTDVNITFRKPSKEVEVAKAYFKTTSPNDAASKAFDYFLKNQSGR